MKSIINFFQTLSESDIYSTMCKYDCKMTSMLKYCEFETRDTEAALGNIRTRVVARQDIKEH